MPEDITSSGDRIAGFDVNVMNAIPDGIYRKLAAEGMTMVVVTHEMRFAREVGNQPAFMDGGVVVESGPPRAMLANPTHERTKAFLSKVL